MSNRNVPPKSFNTVKHSNREKRLKKQRMERMILLTICSVVCLILLSALILLIASAAQAIGNRAGRNPTGGTTETSAPTPGADIIYAPGTQASSSLTAGSLTLVNDQHKFPNNLNSGLVVITSLRPKIDGANIYQIGDTTWQLQSEAMTAFNAMMTDYYRFSNDASIKITSAYRTYQMQQNLGSSIAEGASEHHTGYCIALQMINTDGSVSRLESTHWIYDNCTKYGFIVRYPEEKKSITGVDGYAYCFRYVGIPHATYMTANDLCMEEYLELLRTTYTENHLKITGTDGCRYEVYYTPVSDAQLTTVSLPQNYAYTISGDNVGGFIVTVNLDAPNS